MILATTSADLPETFRDERPLGVDIETTGLCPFQNKIRLIQITNGTETLVIDVFQVGVKATRQYLKPILESKTAVKVLQNAKFDIKFIKQQLGIDIERIFDTYLASATLEGGAKKPKGYHGLDNLAKRYLGMEVSKTEQLSDWSGVLSQSQIEYAAKDVEVLLPLREAMITKLREHRLSRCAKLEFEAVLPIAWLELNGFHLDYDQWLKIADEQFDKSQESAQFIYDTLEPLLPQGSLFGEPRINLRSVKQIQQYFKEAGVPMPDSTTEFFLTPLAEEYPLVKALLDYRGYYKAYNSFGENFKEHINPVTDRIHADFLQYVTLTGRIATSNPNLAQIPADDAHRGCFKAPEGYSLITCDYSQEELRILADFSQDKRFQKMFRAKFDFHTATAANVFRLDPEKVDSHSRTLAKRVNFGVTYCIGPAKLAMSVGISQVEATQIINNYFEMFKGVKRWMEYQKSQVLKSRSARSASGRLMCYEFDDSDPKSRSGAQRNAVNGPIQASASDILKRALRIFYDASKPHHKNVKMVNVVHDQIDIEAKDDIVEEMEALLKKCMKQAGEEYINEVEIIVDSHVSKFWKK